MAAQHQRALNASVQCNAMCARLVTIWRESKIMSAQLYLQIKLICIRAGARPARLGANAQQLIKLPIQWMGIIYREQHATHALKLTQTACCARLQQRPRSALSAQPATLKIQLTQPNVFYAPLAAIHARWIQRAARRHA